MGKVNIDKRVEVLEKRIDNHEKRLENQEKRLKLIEEDLKNLRLVIINELKSINKKVSGKGWFHDLSLILIGGISFLFFTVLIFGR